MIDALKLAKFMFERNAREFTDDPTVVAHYWEDPDVRAFWSAEAEAVISFLASEFSDLETQNLRELEDKELL